jgi:hypothetical protein
MTKCKWAYHDGSFAAYLSKAPGDVQQYDGNGEWFKIWELGLDLSVPEDQPPVWLGWFHQHVCQIISNCQQNVSDCPSTTSLFLRQRLQGSIFSEWSKYTPGIRLCSLNSTWNVLRLKSRVLVAVCWKQQRQGWCEHTNSSSQSRHAIAAS